MEQPTLTYPGDLCQYFCAATGNCGKNKFYCPTGYICSNGVCITCTDTDPEQDKFVAGNCTDINGVTYEDYCSDSKLYQYYCSRGGNCVSTSRACPSGHMCMDGKCIDKCAAIRCREGYKCVDGECVPITPTPVPAANETRTITRGGSMIDIVGELYAKLMQILGLK